MAGCKGCGGGCSCVVTAGSGAQVSGTGTARDPYIVSASGGEGGGGGGGGGFDPGDVKWSARAGASPGWLVANGQPVNRTTYAALFQAIGTAYGPGDGGTTFNVPDLTGRFAVGADADFPRGSTGGSNQRTLSVANMPAHAHAVGDHTHPASTDAQGQHSHTLQQSPADGTSVGRARGGQGGSTNGLYNADFTALPAGNHAHNVGIGAAGGGPTTTVGQGQPFSTVPPYTSMTPLIKT